MVTCAGVSWFRRNQDTPAHRPLNHLFFYLFCSVFNPGFTCRYSTGYLQDLSLYKYFMYIYLHNYLSSSSSSSPPCKIYPETGVVTIGHLSIVPVACGRCCCCLHDIPPIRFAFKVTQKGPGSSLMKADYCRNL
jgi:hypothetical protein